MADRLETVEQRLARIRRNRRARERRAERKLAASRTAAAASASRYATLRDDVYSMDFDEVKFTYRPSVRFVPPVARTPDEQIERMDAEAKRKAEAAQQRMSHHIARPGDVFGTVTSPRGSTINVRFDATYGTYSVDEYGRLTGIPNGDLPDDIATRRND